MRKENSNKFRLVVIESYEEFVYHDRDTHDSEDKTLIESKVTLNNSLISTKISTRLEYSQYLELWIFAFTKFLHEYRKSLEKISSKDK